MVFVNGEGGGRVERDVEVDAPFGLLNQKENPFILLKEMFRLSRVFQV